MHGLLEREGALDSRTNASTTSERAAGRAAWSGSCEAAEVSADAGRVDRGLRLFNVVDGARRRSRRRQGRACMQCCLLLANNPSPRLSTRAESQRRRAIAAQLSASARLTARGDADDEAGHRSARDGLSLTVVQSISFASAAFARSRKLLNSASATSARAIASSSVRRSSRRSRSA